MSEALGNRRNTLPRVTEDVRTLTADRDRDVVYRDVSHRAYTGVNCLKKINFLLHISTIRKFKNTLSIFQEEIRNIKVSQPNLVIEVIFIKGFKVIIARYLFSLDIVKTLHVYYFMLIEYMCEVSKLLTIQNPTKLPLKKKNS